MRVKLVEHDVVECELGLGPNLFYNSPMEACVVICRTAKPKSLRGKVLFINAIDEVTRERSQSFLTDEHIGRIADAYRHPEIAVEGFARLASLDEIRSQDGNLSIPLYVRPANGNGSSAGGNGGRKALDKAITEWQDSSATLRQSMDGLFKTLAHMTPNKKGAK